MVGFMIEMSLIFELSVVNFCKIGLSANEDVILHSIKSKCLPSLLYAPEACPYNKADLQSMDFTVTRFLMKLFKTNDRGFIADCCKFFCFLLLSEIIPCKATQFQMRCAMSDNSSFSFCR
jgi:hypothetical protein